MTWKNQFFRALPCAALAWPLATLATLAQSYTVGGQTYEAATWTHPTALNTFEASTTGTWSGGALSGSGTLFGVPRSANADYPGSGTTWAITKAPAFSPDLGSVSNGIADLSPDADRSLTMRLVPGALPLPTEILYYAGSPENGMKSTVWHWSASDPATTFELVDKAAFSTDAPTGSGPARLVGNGSNALVWRAYAPSTNNLAQAVVRIRNPAGIGDFTLVTNRLVTNTGQPFNTPSQTQGSDFSDSTILLRPRPAAVADTASTSQGTAVTLPAQGNDTVPPGVVVADIDLDPSTPGVQSSFTVTGQGVYDVVRVGGVPQVRFTPAAGFSGRSSARYTLLTDAADTSNPAQITVTVNAPSTPTAVPTLSQVTLAALSLLLGVLGWRGRRS